MFRNRKDVSAWRTEQAKWRREGNEVRNEMEAPITKVVETFEDFGFCFE